MVQALVQEWVELAQCRFGHGLSVGVNIIQLLEGEYDVRVNFGTSTGHSPAVSLERRHVVGPAGAYQLQAGSEVSQWVS